MQKRVKAALETRPAIDFKADALRFFPLKQRYAQGYDLKFRADADVAIFDK